MLAVHRDPGLWCRNMTLSVVTAESVRKAIAECDRLGREPFRRLACDRGRVCVDAAGIDGDPGERVAGPASHLRCGAAAAGAGWDRSGGGRGRNVLSGLLVEGVQHLGGRGDEASGEGPAELQNWLEKRFTEVLDAGGERALVLEADPLPRHTCRQLI
jgi:hypothetical protein